LTGELLILGTQTLPEVPGVRGACVLYPGLGPPDRRVYAPAGEDGKVGIDTAIARPANRPMPGTGPDGAK
jgi:hypothetical protein